MARTLARVGKFQELRSRKIPLKSKRFFSLRGYRAGSRLLFGRILLGGPPQREGVALLRPVSSPHLSTTDEGFLRRHSGWQDWRRTFERTGLLLRTWAGWRAGGLSFDLGGVHLFHRRLCFELEQSGAVTSVLASFKTSCTLKARRASHLGHSFLAQQLWCFPDRTKTSLCLCGAQRVNSDGSQLQSNLQLHTPGRVSLKDLMWRRSSVT